MQVGRATDRKCQSRIHGDNPARTLNRMKVAVFSSKPYDEDFLTRAAEGTGHELTFFEARLDRSTASLADGYEAVCAFVNDDL